MLQINHLFIIGVVVSGGVALDFIIPTCVSNIVFFALLPLQRGPVQHRCKVQPQYYTQSLMNSSPTVIMKTEHWFLCISRNSWMSCCIDCLSFQVQHIPGIFWLINHWLKLYTWLFCREFKNCLFQHQSDDRSYGLLI